MEKTVLEIVETVMETIVEETVMEETVMEETVMNNSGHSHKDKETSNNGGDSRGGYSSEDSYGDSCRDSGDIHGDSCKDCHRGDSHGDGGEGCGDEEDIWYLETISRKISRGRFQEQSSG